MGEEKRCVTFKAVGWPTFSFLNVVILSQRSAWQSQGLPTKDLCTPPAEHERGVPHLSRSLRKVRALLSSRSHSALSSSLRETAVTIFRGLKRTDSATNQFRNPEIASVLPAIIPR